MKRSSVRLCTRVALMVVGWLVGGLVLSLLVTVALRVYDAPGRYHGEDPWPCLDIDHGAFWRTFSLPGYVALTMTVYPRPVDPAPEPDVWTDPPPVVATVRALPRWADARLRDTGRRRFWGGQLAYGWPRPMLSWYWIEDMDLGAFGHLDVSHWRVPTVVHVPGMLFNASVMGAIPFASVVGLSWIRGTVRRRRGRCAGCGYALLSEQVRCPECGASVLGHRRGI